MNYQMKLSTLTPVHVGDGNSLMNGSDYIVRGDGVFIIDASKVASITGTEKSVIDKWVAAIVRNDLNSFLSTHTQGVSLDKLSKRVLSNFATGQFRQGSTLKTLIHDGRGLPYLPGSSIKGAMRSAIFAIAVNAKGRCYNDFLSAGQKKSFVGEDDLFGRMQNDVFRHLRVGDAYFGKNTEVAICLQLLNIKESSEELYDPTRAPQIIEAIDANVSSVFRLSVGDKFTKSRVAQNNGLTNIAAILKRINDHTQSLVKDEIDYWQSVQNEGYCGADNYIENMESILTQSKNCGVGECVLRVGQGIGWRFITGAWAEQLQDFKEAVVPKARLKNDKYNNYDFPKSRRMDDESNLLGFVKLSMEK